MSGPNKTGWLRRAGAILVMAAAMLAGSSNPSVARAYCATRGFVGNFRSIEKSTLRKGLLERVALSLVLVSANSPEPVRANRACQRSPSL
jgi:hypothetical protein